MPAASRSLCVHPHFVSFPKPGDRGCKYELSLRWSRRNEIQNLSFYTHGHPRYRHHPDQRRFRTPRDDLGSCAIGIIGGQNSIITQFIEVSPTRGRIEAVTIRPPSSNQSLAVGAENGGLIGPSWSLWSSSIGYPIPIPLGCHRH